MSKEQVQILLGPPQARSTSAGEMETLAGRFWPEIRTRATEVWVYPLGWRLYFADAELVDITQHLPARSVRRGRDGAAPAARGDGAAGA